MSDKSTPDLEQRHSKGLLPVVTPPGESAGMLPGIAGICIYMLILAMLNAFSAARGQFGIGTAKYSILAASTLLAVGVFGLLRLSRWGWALVTAASLVMAFGYFYGFHRMHSPAYVIQGLFALVFFLYLSRTEVRERLR
jgi:hypothetical protein